jgi:hypothetical protein
MQTFLPFSDFTKSAQVLDRQRLCKQRVETKQIYLAISDPSYGWQNHPAVNQWRGYLNALAMYGHAICGEWKRRGYKDTLDEWFLDRYSNPFSQVSGNPAWLGKEEFHKSHRQTLLFKNFEFYSKFGWAETPKYEYYWPTKNGF